MGTNQRIVATASAAAAAVTVVAAVRHRRGARGWPERQDGRYVTLRGVTVDRPPEVVYEFWRDPRRLAGALGRPARVEVVDDRRARWTVRGPGGRQVSWETELVADEPPRVLAWRTGSSPVPHEGRVELTPAPGGRGTEVRVGLTYAVPGGPAGAAVARITGDEPDQVLRTALRRIKQVLECGEAVTVDGQVSGRSRLQQRVTELVDHRLATGGRP